MQNSFLSRLDWRFATKKFDVTKKLTNEEFNKILHAIRLAPTSFGIQPFHVMVISNTELRMKLRTASYNQSQVTDASHFLVFCARTDVTTRIDDYFEVITGGNTEAIEKIAVPKAGMHGALDSKEGDVAWTARQAYLALGFGLASAAEMGIDSCPMEGFDHDTVDKILELPPHIKSLAYLALGYRAAEPERPKVRFPESDIFEVR